MFENSVVSPLATVQARSRYDETAAPEMISRPALDDVYQAIDGALGRVAQLRDVLMAYADQTLGTAPTQAGSQSKQPMQNGRVPMILDAARLLHDRISEVESAAQRIVKAL